MAVHAESLELLKAKYDIDVSRQKTQVEAAIYQRIIAQKGILFDAAEYYKSNPAAQQYYTRKNEAEARVNQLRGDKKTHSLEYYKALNDFYTFQKMEYKELSASLEKQWYDSASYIASEAMKGSWRDAKLVVVEVWSKKWDLLKTLLDKGVGDAVKSLIYETIDATYKVRFVDYVMANQGATQKIAEYWWDHFIMGNFKKSDTMELIEDVVGKGQEKIQEKLEEKVKERVTDELLKKGEQLAKDELEKKTKEAAEGFIRNLITVPSILIECASKYYNVIDFNLMFLKAAPNEANYLNNEIKRVLKELGKLSDDEIDICYFNSDYFMSLRKQAGGTNTRPKLTKKELPAKTDSRIKLKVTSRLQPEIETAWDYCELEEKVAEQAKQIIELAPAAFDVRPFINLVDAAIDELRSDAIDYPGFKRKADSIKGLFSRNLDGWGNALAAKAIKQGQSGASQDIERKKAVCFATFDRSWGASVAEIDTELSQYLQAIKQASQINLDAEFESLTQTITSKIAAFDAEMIVRSKGIIGNEYLAPSRDGGPSKTISDLLSESGSIRHCFFYQAILKPDSATGQNYLRSQGHIHNGVIILLAGEWFSKSLYDIWYTGYNTSLQLKGRVDRQWHDLYALLSPEKDLWRVYYIDKNNGRAYHKDIAAQVNSFHGRSKSMAINDIYREYSKYTDFVHNLLQKNETGSGRTIARFNLYMARLDAQLAERKIALDWMNQAGKTLSDKNFDDWKAMSRQGVELVARLIANTITIDEFRKESAQLVIQRDNIWASQYYVTEMSSIEKQLTRTLQDQQSSIYLKLHTLYSAYFAKYTVVDKAVFEQLEAFAGQIETALQEKTTIEFSRERIDKLNREDPGYCAKDVIFDLRQCNVAFVQQDFYRLFVWEISYGLLENLSKLEAIYRQAVDAQDQVNQWLAQEYATLYKQTEAAQLKKVTVEEYQALSLKLDSLSGETRTKFWDLMKPNDRYVSIKYTKENTAMTSRLYDMLIAISRSFQ
jgi:hypothetical protein